MLAALPVQQHETPANSGVIPTHSRGLRCLHLTVPLPLRSDHLVATESGSGVSREGSRPERWVAAVTFRVTMSVEDYSVPIGLGYLAFGLAISVSAGRISLDA
jgi:hypothetical protein